MRGEMLPVRQAVSEALWSLCAADSLSMPVHWYYDPADICRDYGGWISGFQPPRSRHPSSILRLSNTAGSGRSSRSSARSPDVVGNVILHDKLDLWRSDNSVHYHQGLQAGDNTLNVLCALRVARSLVRGAFRDVGSSEARAAVLWDYVSFLTTPGSHRDTYAESFHRSFFSDWQHSRPQTPEELLRWAERRSSRKLSSVPDSQLNAIGCLPMTLPFLLLLASANQEQAVSAAVEFVKLTHPHPDVPQYVSIYGRALHAVVGGASVRQEAELALRQLQVWDQCQSYSRKAARCSSPLQRLQVHQGAVSALGLACYTSGALCSLFYLAHEFHHDLTAGLLTNTNCGGENCNRGAALGALLGAGAGLQGRLLPQEWKEELKEAQEFVPDIVRQLQ